MDASIIIPAYNRRDRLRGTLRALDALDYPRESFEVLLVDDGSEDGTGVIFSRQRFPYSFRLIRHENNRGRSAARNTGMRQAKGRVVVFLDDDMEAVPGLLREHLKHHKKFQRQVVLGNIHHAPRVSATALIRYFDSRGVQKLRAGDAIPFRYFSAGNVSMERQFISEVGFFDERFRRFGGEDLELGYRLHRAGAQFVFAPQALAYRHDYHDIGELCRAMTTYGRFSLPVLLGAHPELAELFKTELFEPFDRSTAGCSQALRRAFFHLALQPPWGPMAALVAWALNRFWAPDVLFDYLIFFYYMKGYRDFRKDLSNTDESQPLGQRS